MKNIQLLRIAVLTVGILMGLGSFASVASAATVITNWQDPVPYSFVSFGNPVVINGSYTLPPFWVGTVYVIQDGVQLPQELTINNSLGVTPKTAGFTINLGTQPPLPSPHTIQLEFFGGTADYINGKVPGNSTNNADEYTVPRTYTASGSPDPVLALSYDAAGTQPLNSPALNFANTVVNVSADRIIYVRNVGGGIATGVAGVSGGEDPFYCLPSCAYTITAGAPAVPITFRYRPSIVNIPDNAMLNFSCTAVNCNGINAAITGNSVQDPLLPAIDLNRVTIDYGMQNINTYQDQVLIVTNNGGGTLTGSLSIPGSDFTCVANPTCSFSVDAGAPQSITIRFKPTTAGTKDVTVAETSNGGNYTMNLYGWGNDKPIQKITCLGCAGQYSWAVGTIAIGSNANADVEITNIGAGTATGYLDPTPGAWTARGWSCTSVTEPDGTIVTPLANQPCQYYGVTNAGSPAVAHMSYTALAPSGLVSDSVNFKSTSVPGNDDTLYMTSNVILGKLDIGVYYNFWVNSWLVNNVSHPVSPSTYPIVFTNQGNSPMVVTLTLPTGVGVFTCDISGSPATPCVLDAPNTITFASNESKTINMHFAPSTPSPFTQVFRVCLLGNCSDYTMNGQGQDPRIGVSEVPAGSHDQDKWIVCSGEGGTCTFSGTQTVYYGNGIGATSKVFTNSASCDYVTFGDPTPGIYKYCWVANTENGTWINAPWKSAMMYMFKNAGVGGQVRYKITDATHFKCNIIYSLCSGYVTNYDNETYTYNYDVDHAYIFFNPAQPIFVSEPITIQYHFVPDYNDPASTDCPGNATYCHTMTVTNQGTGISGPKLSTYVTAFPASTNVGSQSTAVLVVQNTGTDIISNIKVNDGTGPFTCLSTCGPYTLAPFETYGSTIQYSASAGGLQNGTALVTSSALPQITVPLQANGNALAQISVTPGSPGFLDYGTVNEGSQAISGNGVVAPIIVTNTGAAPLSGNATITLGNLHFICVTCYYGPLNPGESAEVKIAFVPKDIGSLSGTVSFSGGGGAFLSVIGVGQLGASSFSSTDANFGRVLIKSGSYKEQVVTIINNGSVAVTAGTISWAGTSGGMFTCVPPTPMDGSGKCMYPDIAPNGGTVSFTIRFTPTSPGSKKDTIKFSGSINAKVSVIGIGVVPSVKFKEK